MKSRTGFTLVELLIVIAIIGIFNAILFGSIASSKAKGRDVRRITDMKQIQIALALYFDNNRGYPQGTALDALVAGGYMAEIPIDPQTAAPYEYFSSGPKTYCIGVTLEGLVPNDTVACDSDSGPGDGVSNYKAKK